MKNSRIANLFSETNNTNLLKKTSLNKRLQLPVISLFLNITPILLMLLMGMHLLSDNFIIEYLSFIFAVTWMITGFGFFFHISGIIVAILYFYTIRKCITPKTVAFLFVSILFPLVLWLILIMFEVVNLQMLP